MALDQLAQRQLDLGPAGYFRVEAEATPGNQVIVRKGFLFAGAYRVFDRYTGGDQTSVGFASIGSGPGFKRYDLVYVNATGAVQIAAGTEVVVGAGTFQGAPGFTGGPALPDQGIPCAYVLVTETGAVTITSDRISPVAGVFRVSRDLLGFFIDKGLVGSVPAGASSVVTTNFSGEVSGGGVAAAGVITTATLNLVHLVNQVGNQIQHTASQEPVYARITFSGGVWTLSYFYDNAGTETAVANMSTDIEPGTTDIRMAFTPKVYSMGDPSRPLFASAAVPLTGKVAGEIPSATTTQLGVVLAARVAGDKAGAVSRVQGATGGGGMDYFGIHTINFSAASPGDVTNPSPGVVNVASGGAPGPPGGPGPSGGPGPPGPTGPGFSSWSYLGFLDNTNGPGSYTHTFTFGFTVVDTHASCNVAAAFTDGPAAYITNITKSGTQVTVSYTIAGSHTPTNVQINCTAAG